jgi:hypothetical protein
MPDDNPRDDGDDGGGGNAFPFILGLVAIVVGVFAIASAIGAFKSTQSTTPPPVATCTTSGWGFVKLECPGDRMMGATFGFWGCGDPRTNHPCGTNP